VNRRDFDVIVAGAGAAGLMCAIRAGQRGRRVLLLDHADKVGKKILISGGGRCNFTNLLTRPEAFLSGNPHFCKSALARYTQHDFIDLVDKHRIAWHEKTLASSSATARRGRSWPCCWPNARRPVSTCGRPIASPVSRRPTVSQ
jgi:flavin-dependent dehydrogenase